MVGLEISWSSPDQSRSTESSFFIIFRPFLPDLAVFTWLYDAADGLPFSAHAFVDPDFEQAVDEVLPGDGVIPANTLLPRFARYIKNDWTELYGFRNPPAPPGTFFTAMEEAQRLDDAVAGPIFDGKLGPEDYPLAWKSYEEYVRSAGGKAVNRLLAGSIDLGFFNVDGAYWEVYARDVQLIASIRAYAGTVRGLSAVERSLLDRLL